MSTPQSKSTPTRKPAAVLFVAAFAAFLATFNETFLNVGFAPIMESLSVDVATVQWLATAYMLGAAIMVPVSAFAYRSFPTRPLFCSTVALLVAGSVIGAMELFAEMGISVAVDDDMGAVARVLADRMRTAMNADKIVVLDEGRERYQRSGTGKKDRRHTLDLYAGYAPNTGIGIGTRRMDLLRAAT